MLLSAMPCFKLSPSGLPQLDGLNSWFSWPYYEIPTILKGPTILWVDLLTIGRIPALSAYKMVGALANSRAPGKQTTDVMLSPFIQHSFLRIFAFISPSLE